MLKVFGMIMVIASCSMAGFEFASRAERKKDNLINLKNGIDAMEREIRFSKKPLGEVFIKASEFVLSAVAELFADVGKAIAKSPENAEEIWSDSILKNASKLCFSKSDINIIKNIFSGIGKNDSVSQKKILLNASEKMQSLIEGYQPICIKNAKVYRKIGILLGIFIAVLFI